MYTTTPHEVKYAYWTVLTGSLFKGNKMSNKENRLLFPLIRLKKPTLNIDYSVFYYMFSDMANVPSGLTQLSTPSICNSEKGGLCPFQEHTSQSPTWLLTLCGIPGAAIRFHAQGKTASH